MEHLGICIDIMDTMLQHFLTKQHIHLKFPGATIMCFIKLYEFQFNHVTLTGLRKVAKKHPMKMMMGSLDARPGKSQ